MSHQQGGVVLGMTIMLLLLATLMLHGMQQQLNASLSLVADEQHYAHDFQQAQSALNWGLRRSWSVASGWHCQQQAQHPLRACLLRLDETQGIVVGEAQTAPGDHPDAAASPLRLWHWVYFDGDALRAAPAGWIDFCPLAASQCEING